MILVATICWYDEPVESLRRIVETVAPIANRIVAFDGAWTGFEHDHHASPADQARALADACDEHRIPLVAHRPRRAWESQCAKRTALYREASIDADWIITLDADEELRIDDPSRLLEKIECINRRTITSAINVRVATPGPRGSGGPGTATAPQGVRWQPRLLRADPTLTVGPRSHRTITTDTTIIQRDRGCDEGAHDDKDRRSLRATVHGISVVNHTHSRDAERIASKLAYGKLRDDRGID